MPEPEALDVERFEALYQALGVSTARAGGHLWRVYQRMAVPVGPAAWDYRLPEGEAYKLLRALPGALLVRETGGFDPPETHSTAHEWWVVAGFGRFDVDALPKNARNQVRRGQRACTVEQVSAEFALGEGRSVLTAALGRYRETRADVGGYALDSQRLAVAGSFPDLVEYWAIRTEGRPIGLARVALLGGVEAFMEEVHLDPAGFDAYPMYSLVPALQEAYAERGFTYVNDGFRSLLHETNVQDFLVSKFAWERRGIRDVRLTYRAPIGLGMTLSRPLHPILGRLRPEAQAMASMDRIARSYRREG